MSHPTIPVIDLQGLTKTFGKVRALDGLDLTVRPGEVHGFLGPNGAGKSTTIRALLGLLKVNGGTARVFGLDPWADAVAVHKRLAYVPGDVALWPNLSGGETITCTVDPEGLPAVLTALTAAGVRSLTSTPPSLEELFLDAYRTEGAAR